MAKPDVPPANTGKPINPKVKYNNDESAPRREPKDEPIIRIPNVWPVMGTGVKGRGILNCASKLIRRVPEKIIAHWVKNEFLMLNLIINLSIINDEVYIMVPLVNNLEFVK